MTHNSLALGKILCFLPSADLFFFFSFNVFENSLRYTIRVSNGLDPEQARRIVLVQSVC